MRLRKKWAKLKINALPYLGKSSPKMQASFVISKRKLTISAI
jgi:hypothetical protein